MMEILGQLRRVPVAEEKPDRRLDDLERRAYSMGEAARDADHQYHDALLAEIEKLAGRVKELEAELDAMRALGPGPNDRTMKLPTKPEAVAAPWTTAQEFDLCVQMRTLGRAMCPNCNVALCRGTLTESAGPCGISVPISCLKCGNSFTCKWDERPRWAGRTTIG
jgi:hypothetical protein